MEDVVSFTKVKLPNGWLGNMAPYPVTYNMQVYKTGEALFQALRFDDGDVKEFIRRATSPMTAKMIAKSASSKMVVERLSSADLDNMRLVLRLKLEQHPALLPLLLATGDATIIEDCSARPRGSGLFWGMANVNGVWTGQNWLGRLWMEIRKEHQ